MYYFFLHMNMICFIQTQSETNHQTDKYIRKLLLDVVYRHFFQIMLANIVLPVKIDVLLNGIPLFVVSFFILFI